MKKITIGVLALQGCVEPHRIHIEKMGAIFKSVRFKKELDQIDALILPGGESTTFLKLIESFEMEEPLLRIFNQIPIWGICAGAILIAKKVAYQEQKSFKLLPIEIQRNAYGRQQDSFESHIENYPVVFIRAPKITSVEKSVTIQAVMEGSPVWIQAGSIMATTFHPELTPQPPSPMHQKFLKDIILSNRTC